MIASKEIAQVIIADDHRWVREGLKATLHRPPALVVAGVASEKAELVTLARQTPVSVVLLDLFFGEECGLHLVEDLRPWCPPDRIILLTAWERPGYASRARKTGLGGFLLKQCNDDSLFQAVLAVANGENCFEVAPSPSPVLSHISRWDELSPTEWAVVRALVEAGSPKMAAPLLDPGYSAKTVHNHLASIYAKLETRGFRSVIELYQHEGMHLDPTTASH